jgi:hypothetical protein
MPRMYFRPLCRMETRVRRLSAIPATPPVVLHKTRCRWSWNGPSVAPDGFGYLVGIFKPEPGAFDNGVKTDYCGRYGHPGP